MIKKFSSRLGEAIAHAGIVIYTDPTFLERDPDTAVRTLDRIFGTIIKKGWRMNDSGWISGECRCVAGIPFGCPVVLSAANEGPKTCVRCLWNPSLVTRCPYVTLL